MAPPAAALIETWTNFTKLLKKNQWQQSAKMADTATESSRVPPHGARVSYSYRRPRQTPSWLCLHSWRLEADGQATGCRFTPAWICTGLQVYFAAFWDSGRVIFSRRNKGERKEEGSRKKEYIYSNHLADQMPQILLFIFSCFSAFFLRIWQKSTWKISADFLFVLEAFSVFVYILRIFLRQFDQFYSTFLSFAKNVNKSPQHRRKNFDSKK